MAVLVLLGLGVPYQLLLAESLLSHTAGSQQLRVVLHMALRVVASLCRLFFSRWGIYMCVMIMQ